MTESCDKAPVPALSSTLPLFYPDIQQDTKSGLCLWDGTVRVRVRLAHERILPTRAPSGLSPPLLLPNEFGRKVTRMTIRMTTKRRLITYRLITYLLVTFGLTWGLWHAPITMMGHNYGRGYPGFPFTGIFVWSCSAQVFRYASRICA